MGVRTLGCVSGPVLLWALLGVAVGAVGATVLLWLLWGGRAAGAAGGAGSDAYPLGSDGSLPAGVSEVLGALASTTIVVDRSDLVVSASPSAAAFGLVRRNGLVHDDIRALVERVRASDEAIEDTLQVSRGWAEPGGEELVMSVRVAPLGEEHVLVLVQDKTHELRLERVRRDFVANISHELKTPVGGLSLLAEAVLDAKDDPQAVERFAARMQLEATRLSRLVKDIVDLTRLQVADALHEPMPVDVGTAVREAVDATSVLAEASEIHLETVVQRGLTIFGDEDLIVTAVRNLVTNAVSYSDPGTRVAVRAHRRGDTVEVVVADHGLGIPLEEQDRIFERFYRVDPARSRATGGTGLGLAIVKHVCAIHGGDVTVWSQEGRGSTFTIRLPLIDRVPTVVAQHQGLEVAPQGAPHP